MGKHISHIKSNLTVDSYVNKETGVVVDVDFYNLLSSDEQSKFELTTSPKLPTPEQLTDGEIAINYAAEYETISLKNNLSEIVSFKPDTYNSEKYTTNTYVQENLGDIIVNKDALNSLVEAEGDNGVLTKTTNGDTISWSYTEHLYSKGSAEDLNTGTDTTEKVWDAKTIADYVQDNAAAATKFKGGFNAGTGVIDGGSATLTSVAEEVGDMYTVTTAGTFAGTPMEVGDSIVFKKAVAENIAPTANDVVFVNGPARYVSSAAFADDTTLTPASPVKMTLTRAGSDSATVTANLPKVSSTSAGVAPKGATVSTQSQSTKFLREDGTWAAPSYTTNTNTTYTFANGTSASGVGTFQVTPSTDGSAQTVTVYGVQGQVGALGSSTEPLYTSADGTFAECSTYAGGTKVTLNGTDKGANTASFYAPTALGTAGQVLKTNSDATAVEWGTLASSDLPSNIVYNTLGNNVTISSSTPSIPVANRVVEANITSDANISLAAQSTKGAEIHVILSNASESDYTLTIPHGIQSTIDYYNTVGAAQGSLVCAAGSKHEINFLFGSISSGVQTVYVRYA